MYKSDWRSSGTHPVYSTGTNLMYRSDFGALRCPLLKWSTSESAGRHTRSYLTYRFIWWLRSSLVLFQVSNESRNVTLARLYLVEASACDSRKLQSFALYTVLPMLSKVTRIINPHTCNTLCYFPIKRMYFRAPTGRLNLLNAGHSMKLLIMRNLGRTQALTLLLFC